MHYAATNTTDTYKAGKGCAYQNDLAVENMRLMKQLQADMARDHKLAMEMAKKQPYVAGQMYADSLMDLAVAKMTTINHDQKEEEKPMTIGADKCHLCGSRRVRLEKVNETVTLGGKKKENQYEGTKQSDTSDYACHTIVTVCSDGKNVVLVGDECIVLGYGH